MTRPVIAITAYRERARWGVWDLPAVLVPAGYVDKVSAAGGLPALSAPAISAGSGCGAGGALKNS